MSFTRIFFLTLSIIPLGALLINGPEIINTVYNFDIINSSIGRKIFKTDIIRSILYLISLSLPLFIGVYTEFKDQNGRIERSLLKYNHIATLIFFGFLFTIGYVVINDKSWDYIFPTLSVLTIVSTGLLGYFLEKRIELLGSIMLNGNSQVNNNEATLDTSSEQADASLFLSEDEGTGLSREEANLTIKVFDYSGYSLSLGKNIAATEEWITETFNFPESEDIFAYL